jgi:hypothetical protein
MLPNPYTNMLTTSSQDNTISLIPTSYHNTIPSIPPPPPPDQQSALFYDQLSVSKQLWSMNLALGVKVQALESQVQRLQSEVQGIQDLRKKEESQRRDIAVLIKGWKFHMKSKRSAPAAVHSSK